MPGWNRQDCLTSIFSNGANNYKYVDTRYLRYQYMYVQCVSSCTIVYSDSNLSLFRYLNKENRTRYKTALS